LDQLTSLQLSEWEAYDKLDPIGTWRDDFRMAYLSSLVTNLTISVNGKKGAKMTSPIDFLPDWADQRGAKVIDDVKPLAQQIKEIFGAIAKANKKKEDLSKRPPVKKTNRKP
jgi:hypothetical protein